MYYQAPMSSAFLLIMSLFLENPFHIVESSINLSPMCFFIIFMTAVASFFLNFSTYYLVAKSSTLTYNIISHSKKVVLFFSGVFLFGDKYTGWQIFGIFVATSGLVFYSNSGDI